MASEKISAMPSATEVGNTDVVPVVQSGANKKSTRLLLLTAGSGEEIALNAAAGQFAGIQAGSFSIMLRDDGFLNIIIGGANIQCDGSGNLTIRGTAVTLNATSGAFIIEQGTGQNISVQFNTANPGNWTSAPNDLASAVDRIAAALVSFTGSPIP
jgi:hypothetical protein